MKNRIGVAGSFIRDTIITLENETVESIGGLYHSIAYLASLADDDTTIVPLCNVGADFYPRVVEVLSQFEARIELDRVRVLQRPNTAVKLVYRDAETRDEFTTEPMPPLPIEALESLADCDIILVNFISGQELDLADLIKLEARSNAPLLYLDLHSWVLGIDDEGRRFLREVPDWRGWMPAVDILQLNEREAAALAGLRRYDRNAFIRFGRSLVRDHVSACHITLGSQGSLAFYRENNAIRHEHFEVDSSVQSVDVIGCGDAFGAAFVLHYVCSHDFLAATRFANRIAGLNGAFLGSLTKEKFDTYIKPRLHEVSTTT